MTDTRKVELAHIINPVSCDSGYPFWSAQAISHEAVRRAVTFSENKAITLFAVGFEDDKNWMPRSFTALDPLSRSVLDFGPFDVERRLPLIADILSALLNASRASYLIYTNADICVLPHFYESVRSIIAKGYDSFVINRRCIPTHYREVSELSLMYAECGEPHPGYDCFVMHRDTIDLEWLGNACIGMPGFDCMLVAMLARRSQRFQVFEDLHLTFHIGNDKSNWKNENLESLRMHNVKEGYALACRLEAEGMDLGRDLPRLAAKTLLKYKRCMEEGAAYSDKKRTRASRGSWFRRFPGGMWSAIRGR